MKRITTATTNATTTNATTTATSKHFSDAAQPSGVFYKKAVLKNFSVFTEKHLCWSLCKVTGLKAEKRLQHRRFPAKIAKFLRTTFL